MVPLKNNLAAACGGLAYTIVPRVSHHAPMVVWDPKRVPLDADGLLQEVGRVKAGKCSRKEAIEWLRGELADGRKPASHVRSDAKEEGINYSTLRRAFKELGGKSTQLVEGVPSMWMWELPEEGTGL